MQFVIEPPCTKDAAALASIHIRSYQATYKNILPDEYLDNLSHAATTSEFISKLAHPKRSLLVARQNGILLGYGYFGPQSISEIPCDGEIVELYIKQEARSQGVGRRLVYAMMKAMAGAGLMTYSVWALSLNTSACRFYTSLEAQKFIEGPIHWPGIEELTFNAICYYWPRPLTMLNTP